MKAAKRDSSNGDNGWRPDPLVLTVQQVAELLQVSRDTVENLHRTRQLPAVRIGKHNRWRPQDVRAFVDRLTGADNLTSVCVLTTGADPR